MRPILALSLLLSLAACANPYTDPEGYRRDVDAFFGSPVGQVVKVPTAVLMDAAANTSTSSGTVRTDHGTYDVNSSCTYGMCDSSVSKR